MFNRYLSEDREAFEDLYRPVQEEEEVIEEIEETVKEEPPEPVAEKEPEKTVSASKNLFGGKLDFKRILKGINLGDLGLMPLLLLAFLVLDVEDDEKLLIFALAIVLGI